MAKKPRTPQVPDEVLFESAMRDVDALKKKAAVSPPVLPPDKPPSNKLTTDSAEPAKPRSAPRFPPVASQRLAPLNPGRSGDVDTRTSERLRRGQLRPEARLDLHGMYQDAAQGALVGFITESAARGHRCVLVITGRGSREGSGVLRERLPQWLNQPPCRAHVLAFTPARPQHGRDGAFYVLLRRKRGDRS